MQHTMRSSLVKLVGLAALAFGASAGAQAAVLKENFNAAFPAWESGWFATYTDAANSCATTWCLVDGDPVPPNPAVRGNAGSGMWLSSDGGFSSSPITITFDPAFGAALKAFKFDVSAYVESSVQAWDMAGTLIYARKLKINDYHDIPTSNYQKVLIRSTTGIARFTITGYANGNTVIDNVGAVLRAAGE